MDNLQKTAYCLSASGALVAPDCNRLIHENEGILDEEVWDPESGETLHRDQVGDGVKSNAPVAYVWYSNGSDLDDPDEDEGLGSGERLIFSISPDNNIIAFKYDFEEDDIWKEDASGGIGKIELHPESGLAAAMSPQGLLLFFMTPNRRLQAAVRTGGEEWTILPHFPAEPKIGTPLATTVTDNATILFYFGIDDTMHYLRRENMSEDWVDNAVENIIVESPITRFRASIEEDGHVEAYVLTNGRLLQLSNSGEPVDVGAVEERQLRKSNDAQNIRWMSRGCRPYFYRVRYVVVYHYFVPRIRGLPW
ncbi:hypothetical protein TWF730_003529 [Orbilia blumenaviensis]|uniref:Uncharacterized protein n=1 Tax=Orbilia blumenaviensis TaxID=1796055 RepID=A0AAV9U4N1_9PEZI